MYVGEEELMPGVQIPKFQGGPGYFVATRAPLILAILLRGIGIRFGPQLKVSTVGKGLSLHL